MTPPRRAAHPPAELLAWGTFILIGWIGLLSPSLIRSIKEGFDQTDAGIGLYYFVYAVAYATGSLGGGLVTERLGRRTVLTLGAALTGIGLVLMGVLPAWHRRGIGRALVERAASYARAEGFTLLHVKTLAPSDPDPGYAATRRFYEAMCFVPLEELPQVWGPENSRRRAVERGTAGAPLNPCLLLVRPL